MVFMGDSKPIEIRQQDIWDFNIFRWDTPNKNGPDYRPDNFTQRDYTVALLNYCREMENDRKKDGKVKP
jgi:hypothetical protein